MRFTAAVISAAVMMLLPAQAAWSQEAPKLDSIPESVAAPLLKSYVDTIDAYTRHYAGQLRSAKDEAGIVAAREALVSGYKANASPAFKFGYAQSAAANVAGVFDAKDEFKTLRQVNAGLALSNMPSVAVQPALEKMAVHADAVVRLYGWQGYRAARQPILGQGKDNAQAMFKLLAQQMPKESSAAIIGAMLDILDLGQLDLSVLDKEVQKLANQQAYGIFAKNWHVVCQSIIAGDASFASAASKGVSAATYLLSVADAEQRKVLLQGMMDIIFCGATAFDAVVQELPSATGRAKHELEVKAESYAGLLRDAEDRLKMAVSGKDTPIAEALKQNGQGRGLAVLQGMVKWLTELKGQGVVDPKYARPTTNPATAPA